MDGEASRITALNDYRMAWQAFALPQPIPCTFPLQLTPSSATPPLPTP